MYTPSRMQIVTAYGVVAAVLTAKTCIKVTREERAKRAEIDRNLQLDLAAIHSASRVIVDRIDAGEIRSLDALRDAINTEINFQKIAVREEP